MAKQTEQFTDMKRVAKELISLMKQNDLTEVELVEDKSKITLRRGTHGPAPAFAAPGHAPAPAHHAPAPAAPAHCTRREDEKLIPIKSPLVGTFYSAPPIRQSDPYCLHRHFRGGRQRGLHY